jgi:hypothetical protein
VRPGFICAQAVRSAYGRARRIKDDIRQLSKLDSLTAAFLWTIAMAGPALTPNSGMTIYWSRSTNCAQPYVKGYTNMVNSIYNGFRFEDVWLDK